MEIMERSVWEALKEEPLPIVLYGTGNGAEKIIKKLKEYNIPLAAVFSSDGFSKNKLFCGYKVESLSEIQKRLERFVMLLGFAAGNEELISYVKEMGKRAEKFLVPEVPVFGEDVFTRELYNEKKAEIEALSRMLADEQSKRVLKNLLEYKLSGKPEYLYEIETERKEIFENIFALSRDETFLDLGAFCGDTVEEFLENSGGKYKKIIALEPAPKNFERLNLFREERKLQNIELINAAVAEKEGQAFFSEKGGRNPFLLDEGKYPVKIITVDSLKIAPSFIKIDVEGKEKETLLGSVDTIKTYAPKIAMSLYHKNLDFLELPKLLKSIEPRYRLYLRHHPYLPAWETNLYAQV